MRNQAFVIECQFIYLGPSLSLDIYKLFQDELEKQLISNKPSLTWFYNHWRNMYPNIKIKSPKTDTCDDCNKYKVTPNDQKKSWHWE